MTEIKYHEHSFDFADAKVKKAEKKYQTNSYLKDVWSSFSKNKGALIGFIIILIIIIMAIIGPYLNDHTYKSAIIEHSSLPPKIEILSFIPIFSGFRNGIDMYAAKAVETCYWFGTDTLGRDIFTRVWEGTRISLIIAFTAVIIDVFIGMVYGLISGYFGKRVDIIMQRIAEILNGIPTLVVVTLLGLILEPGMESIILSLVVTGWIGMSRIARSQVLKLKEQEYILASKTLGSSHFSIIFKDILPNIFGQIIIMSMFSIPNAIFLEAYLSFVGLGIPAPLASLGSLISEGYKSLTVYPHMILGAVIVLATLMLCFNLFADGLRDAFDPQQKQM